MIDKSTPLINLFSDYRAGNISTFDKIIYSKSIFNKKGKFQYIQTKIDNTDLEGMIVSSFNDFQYNPRAKPKKKKGYFLGQINEVYSIYLNNLISLVNDKDFNPKDNAELCGKLKYNANKEICQTLVDKYKNISLNTSNVVYDKDGSEIADSPFEKQQYQEWLVSLYQASTGYIGLFRELLKVQHSADINSLLPVNSDFQRKLIDIFKYDEDTFHEENDTLTLNSIKEISELFNRHFDKLPQEEQIIQAMNTIYERLMKCAVGYVYCSRKEFNKNNSNGCYCLKNIYQMLSYHTERIIERANKGDNHIAGTEYGNAYDMLIERINVSVKLLKDKGFEPDVGLITNIALFGYDKNTYWNFGETSNGDYKIDFYTENESTSGTYNLQRKEKIVFNSLPSCYLIGNCVIYADNDTKKLTYLQKENRLFYVKKSNNKYYGYKIIS